MIVSTVAIAVPVSGPIITLVSACLGALYFAYFVPEPVTGLGAAFMRIVPGFFALAPLAAVLRIVNKSVSVSADDTSVDANGHDQKFEQLLQEVGTLDATFSYKPTLDRVARLALPLLADWVVVYDHGNGGAARRVLVAAEDRAGEDALDHALQVLPRQLGGHDPLAAVAEVLRTAQPRYFPDVAVNGLSNAGRNSAERLVLDGMEPGTMIMAPLRAHGRLLGAVIFARRRGSSGYRRDDLAKVLEYCRRAALIVESADRYEAAFVARAEAESARDHLLGIVDQMTSGFIVLDNDARVTHMNRAAERLTARKRKDLLGCNLWQALPPNTRDAPLASFAIDATRRQSAATTELSVSWTGEARWLEIHVEPSPAGSSLYLRDVTEHRAMADRLRAQEDVLRQSQKMEAVGRLSGRLAHDFNNLLMSIAGCAELLLKKVGDNEPARDDIREIVRSTERASSLTRQMMTYSRKQVHQPRLVDLGSTVTEMQRRLLNVLREDIVLAVNVIDAATPAKVDPNQIEQVLLNFAVNSRDAMPNGGRLTISVSNLELKNASDRDDQRSEKTRYVCLEVTDTGRGIDPAVLPHIFEPFFTTKSADKGTGLGLASVYGIVRQNHGSITVNSTVGRGTTFQVLFPAAACLEDELPFFSASPPAIISQPAEPVPTEPASGLILVAEDESAVRGFVCSVLRERGYTVLEARTGVEGLAVARRHVGAIDLLLTDVVMPEMGGRDLASKLLESDPGTRILFMSGYAENEIAHHGVLTSGAQLLEKPFSAAILLERVRTALEEPPAIVRFSSPAA
jgi:PAS domain S-box-containing protein